MLREQTKPPPAFHVLSLLDASRVHAGPPFLIFNVGLLRSQANASLISVFYLSVSSMDFIFLPPGGSLVISQASSDCLPAPRCDGATFCPSGIKSAFGRSGRGGAPCWGGGKEKSDTFCEPSPSSLPASGEFQVAV